MMISIKCSGCQGDISIHHEYVGDMIQCPYCGALQIVPDQILQAGTVYNGYTVRRAISTSVLWTAYEVAAQPNNLALCIPTSFFLKRVSDISSFADSGIYGSSLNRPELPSLISHSLSPEVFFVFDYQSDAVKLASLIKSKPLDIYSALRVSRNIATCLKFLWDEYHVLHQCLIPDNIWMNPGLSVRIKNTGIASYLLSDQQLLESGFNVWDHHYISPEFLNEGIVDSPACDIYSLGAVLFFLCTSAPPNEGVPPELIASTPPPYLNEFIPEAPHGLSVLIQLMMSPDPSSRASSWDEVLKHIDILLANQVQPSAQPFSFPSAPRMTGYHQPIGLNPGELTQSIKREEALEGLDNKRKTAAHKTIRPIPRNSLSTMNRKWKKGGRVHSSPGESKQPKQADEKPHQQKKKDDNTPIVILLSVAALVAAIIVAAVIINSNKSKTPQRKAAPAPTQTQPQKVTDSEAAYARQLELLRKQGIDPQSVGDKQSKTPAARQDTAQTQPQTTPAPPRPTRSTSSVDQVMDNLKKQILPLLREEKYEEAINTLMHYDGELARESRVRRLELCDEIKNRIAQLKAEGPATADTAAATDAPATQAREPQQSPEELQRKLLAQIAPLLFKGQYTAARQQIDAAAITSSGGTLKNNLENLSSQLAALEKIKPQLASHSRADNIIRAEENKDLMEQSFLLQGLLYWEKKQTLQAKLAFEKMPQEIGAVFVSAMEKTIAENE